MQNFLSALCQIYANLISSLHEFPEHVDRVFPLALEQFPLSGCSRLENPTFSVHACALVLAFLHHVLDGPSTLSVCGHHFLQLLKP